MPKKTSALTVAVAAVAPTMWLAWSMVLQPTQVAAQSTQDPRAQDCEDDSAICTEDGGKLSNSLNFTVSGPNWHRPAFTTFRMTRCPRPEFGGGPNSRRRHGKELENARTIMGTLSLEAAIPGCRHWQ